MSRYWTAPKGLFENSSDVADVFNTIYSHRVWGGGSGAGSDPTAVRDYAALLQNFVISNGVRSIVDIGCGDWRFSRYIEWGSCSYFGIDVVPSVIEANKRQFARDNVRFSCSNPLDDDFTVPAADLLLMKDVLQHLSNENVLKLLRLARRFKFALITNDYMPENTDCNNGDTRPLDLRALPFSIRHAAILLQFNGKATFLVVNAQPAQ